jgi:Zn finger protein HypA/HybF involved in hydrogenase expression
MQGKYLDYQFVKQFISQNGCELMSNYYIANEKLQIRCSCGNIFYTKFYNFNHAEQRQCPSCGKSKQYQNRNRSPESVSNEIESNGGLLAGGYTRSYAKVEVQCSCGNLFSSTISNLRQKGYKCNLCTIKREQSGLSDNFVRSYIDKTSATLIDSYKNNNTPMLFRCECGREFRTSFKRFVKHNKTICNTCSRRVSSIEKQTEIYLINKNLPHKSEYSFSDLRGIRGGFLKFDFAILKNNDVILLIELDGEFHYRPILGESLFELQKQNDNLKTFYCVSKNIPLVRIPYWEFKNLSDILDKTLQDMGILC